MQYIFDSIGFNEIETDLLVCFVPMFDKLADKQLKAVDEATDGSLALMLKSGEFCGESGQMAMFYSPSGMSAKRLLLLGLGDIKKIDADTYRRTIGTASKLDIFKKIKSASFYMATEKDADIFQAVAEGYILGSYELSKYKTNAASKKKSKLSEFEMIIPRKGGLSKLERATMRGVEIAEGQTLVRDLSGTPSNDLTPSKYCDLITTLAKEHKISCRILDEAAIKREKMGALLSVAKGSVEPPRFAVLQYKGGPEGQKPIVLVGKGVTFDAGGISLRPSAGMHEMKQDMTGSAVVLSAILTASRLGIARNIVALIPMAENMPSGHATRPGDIIKSRKGLTIENINTDAEGRLLLADALDYASKFDPQAVIDVATLTGATLYILGYSGAPIMGNNSKLMDQLRTASDNTAERVWEMPIWDDFRDQMKSPIADLTNSGGRPAGTCAAAAFLENFIGDWPWAHIDIAYVDLEPKGRPYVPKGATGFGLRLLIDLLSNWKKV